MFKLLRYFSVTSFLAFLAIGLLLTFLYRQQAIRELTLLEGRKHQDITTFLYHDFEEEIQGLLAGQVLPDFAAFEAEIYHHLEGSLTKLELFNAQGRAIFEAEARGEHEKGQGQDEPLQVTSSQAQSQPDDPELLAALKGEVETELVPRGSKNDEGELSEHNLIASYIPIYSQSNGTLQGVFEVYSNADEFIADIQRTQTKLSLTLVGLLAGLYLLLLMIVEHAQKVLRWQHAKMQQQQASLEQERERLEREIAERKRVEVALAKQSEDLLRSNKDLETFAYVASHDLQEPLRKVQTFSDRIVSKYGDALGEDGKVYVTRMQESLGRMRGLITDLLAYSRVQNSQQEVVQVDLNEVVREVVSDLEVRLEQSGGRVVVGPLPSVQASPLQMRQVFQNLIGNALKFKQEGVAPVVQISAKQLGDLHEILVQDNGIGFEQQYAERIFEVFQRLQGRGSYEGTGIGLAIVKKILEQHGGEIRAEGEVGQGAKFYLTFPRSQAASSAVIQETREGVPL